MNKYKRNLCDYCAKEYPDCDSKEVEHGCDFINMPKEADNVAFCDAFTMSEHSKSKATRIIESLELIEIYKEFCSN